MPDEIERLRAALHEPPAEQFAPPDLTRIMADGKRLRRRRRALSGAGAAAAVVAVLAVVFGTVWLRTPGPAQQVPAAAPPTASDLGTPAPTTPVAPVPTQPIGDVITTDLRTPDGQLVFYFAKVDQVPGVDFGVMAGLRTADRLQPLYLANETKGSDTSFGFHGTSGGTIVGRTRIPVFGYFSGPAEQITTTVGGRTLAAHTARWSKDPDVVMFWFDPKDVPSAARLTPLVAYTADGKRLTR
ncbi:hypothetical protein [Amycolatopsis jiangsuensis]|uniref:Uncharacterized protein n=1 Tax=Amycolatopsis jiangsuensis TaxID=1181879 RepID=A0A840J1D9_9PSEU|nr:hypothetical protein [Amycolatopsis jiangsuensis]MBB4687024.1 hypothetical protein [Amycolatopsis jiangsuensis]